MKIASKRHDQYLFDNRETNDNENFYKWVIFIHIYTEKWFKTVLKPANLLARLEVRHASNIGLDGKSIRFTHFHLDLANAKYDISSRPYNTN